MNIPTEANGADSAEGHSITSENVTRVVGDLRHHGNYTLGTLLTAVEAALGDSKQAEALKAITRREMFDLMNRNQAEIYERVGQQKPWLAPKETWIDGQDSLKENGNFDK